MYRPTTRSIDAYRHRKLIPPVLAEAIVFIAQVALMSAALGIIIVFIAVLN